ncbi:MAG: NUDIX domain-containing protein [Actinomycetota bacterium]
MPLPKASHGSPKPYRDATGASLADYPQPSVAVDTAVLTLAPRNDPAPGAPPHRLSVLLVRRPDGAGDPQWALPGTFLHQGERLAGAVTRSLTEKAAVTGGHPAQLAVFDDPDRDERGWVLSVAHLAVIAYADLAGAVFTDPNRVRLAPASRPGPLPYDHNAIVDAARKELRRRYGDRPDPEHLLGRQFTFRELRDVHEAVAGTTLQKDTFRRAMEPHLRGTGTLSTGTVGRPSQRFRRAR